jgi:hypothetical protein
LLVWLIRAREPIAGDLMPYPPVRGPSWPQPNSRLSARPKRGPLASFVVSGGLA